MSHIRSKNISFFNPFCRKSTQQQQQRRRRLQEGWWPSPRSSGSSAPRSGGRRVRGDPQGASRTRTTFVIRDSAAFRVQVALPDSVTRAQHHATVVQHRPQQRSLRFRSIYSRNRTSPLHRSRRFPYSDSLSRWVSTARRALRSEPGKPSAGGARRHVGEPPIKPCARFRIFSHRHESLRTQAYKCPHEPTHTMPREGVCDAKERGLRREHTMLFTVSSLVLPAPVTDSKIETVTQQQPRLLVTGGDTKTECRVHAQG